ncbi:MAG TPA: hypothetical protein VK864_11785, partial [Longimicrobiales bacterium]|nr:hypothetical protein [Longimicrobiales bacterium]
MSHRDQTPVPLLTIETERDHLGDLLARRYNRVLALSDLHLYTGQDPATQTYPFRENFQADDAFARCLGHYFKEDGPNTLIVLNGDLFDFIRIERCPTSKPDFAAWRARLDRLGAPSGGLEERISKSERRFGLRTEAD